MSALTFLLQVLGYDDVPPTNNPMSRGIDYSISQANIPVDNPATLSFDVDPGTSFVAVDGTRATSIDNTTGFNLTLNAADPTKYRLQWNGGTAPAFRVDRGVVLTGITLNIAMNPNLTLTVVASVATPFTSVVSGDVVFIPGVATGDSAGPFNALNVGFWNVLSATNTTLTLARAPGEVFSGSSDTVTAPTSTQFQVFGSAGVQVGDTVDLSSGFAPSALNSYDITAVTAQWVEFMSTAPLGNQTAIVPTTSGIAFYTMRKRYVGVRADQSIAVRYNGDTSNLNRVDPLLPGTDGMEGSAHKFGSVWKLEIYNRSTVRTRVRVSSAE